MKKLTILFILLVSTIVFAQPIENNLTYKGNAFSYYSNHSLTEKNEKIEQMIIVVHGSERNADTYFRSVSTMANKLGRSENTFIISPHFKEPQDKQLPGEHIWTSEGWLRGDQSLVNGSVSSFQIVENFVEILAQKEIFPNLKKVVITGHSAGGQLVQRFAIGSKLENKLSDLQFRYIVANPGSYAYLTKTRPVALPANSACAYNDYKYGLENLNPYMSLNNSVDEMTKRYVLRNVIYLVGEKDTISEDIDQDCPAQAQGLNRLIRAYSFKEILDLEFPQNIHEIYTVPGVGHTQWGVYTSEIGSNQLFN